VVSDIQLATVFEQYEGKAVVQTIEIEKSRYVVVRLQPNNGASLFPCLVYERIDPELWHLRRCFWFYFSNSYRWNQVTDPLTDRLYG